MKAKLAKLANVHQPAINKDKLKRYKTTRGWTLDRVHNSRRPLHRLQCVFALCDPVTVTFNLSIPNSYQGYSSLNNLGSFVFLRTDKRTQTDADERFTSASDCRRRE